MKRTDIVTTAILGVGLLGLAAIGAIAYKLDAWKFRARVRDYATQFPDSMRRLRDDLITEEMIVETEPTWTE